MFFNRAVAIKTILLFLLVLVLFLSQFFWDVSSFFNPGKLQDWLVKSGGLAPLIFMLVMAGAVVISPIPSLPLDIAAGAFFGPFWGTIYSSIGALAGAVAGFLIARGLGRDLIVRLVGGHINFCARCSDKLLTKIVFLSRLLPVVSFDVISYGAGLTKMSLSKFSIATYFGMLPLTFVYNYYGAVVTFGKGLTIIFGLIMVFLFVMLPRWIETYNLFSLRRFFQHDPDRPE